MLLGKMEIIFVVMRDGRRGESEPYQFRGDNRENEFDEEWQAQEAVREIIEDVPADLMGPTPTFWIKRTFRLADWKKRVSNKKCPKCNTESSLIPETRLENSGEYRCPKPECQNVFFVDKIA